MFCGHGDGGAAICFDNPGDSSISVNDVSADHVHRPEYDIWQGQTLVVPTHGSPFLAGPTGFDFDTIHQSFEPCGV